ncbi:MAG TPA: nicotinate phosphoribosyltransferase [Acidimicrobiales bacterium]|nr:nicotinate phosphoribosyltransferase [Acidimicrobiales bacterium]
MPGALLTDLYELTMAASYLKRGMTAPATFSLFVRRLPPTRRFLVAAGLEHCLAYLEAFSFEAADLEYLGHLGFDDDTVARFAQVRFTGRVRAVPEGRIAFAEEPLLEVTAPIAEAQLVETALLNQLTFQTALASKAARARLAADDRIELVEFGFRRTHGTEAGMAAARCAAMVGFAATSNVEAARRYGLVAAGTMAHSYVEAFPSELEAFSAFGADLPGRATFLVDTYDTLDGVRHAIEVINQLGLEQVAAVRLDSGDLPALARATRGLLDEAGLASVQIFVSGGLDEMDLARFVAQGVPVDAAGLGTRLGVAADAPYLDSAYKLVAYGGRPVVKLSEGKASLPGAKQVFRGPGLDDVLALADEAVPAGSEPLLLEVMAGGRRLRPPGTAGDTLAAARQVFEADLAELPRAARGLDQGPGPAATLSPALRQLTGEVRAAAGQDHGGKTTKGPVPAGPEG